MLVRMGVAGILALVMAAGCGKKPEAVTANFLNDPAAMEVMSKFDAQCTKVPSEPKLVAKFVVIDADQKINDPSFVYLPDKFKARNWQELQTLVLVRTTREQVGVYKSSGLPALQLTSTVTFIDYPKKQVFHEKIFVGGMPDKRDLNSDTSTAEGVGPTDQIVEYLRPLLPK